MKRASGSDSLPYEGTTFVLGKGGVGKSVISEGLAALAAKAGLRTLLVRIGESVAAKAPKSRSIERSKHGFDEIDLDPRAAMDEYVHDVVRIRPLVERITRSEVYRKFFAAAPGLPELVLLGRIRAYSRELDRQGENRFQTLVVDCPSSGHGLLMMETPFAAFRAVSIGPFARLAQDIISWLRTSTQLALVAIPEEMAVVESLEFNEDLRERTGLRPVRVFLNRLRRESLSTGARLALSEVEAAPGSHDQWLLDCARRVQRRTRLESFHHRRLAKGLGLEPVVVGELSNCRPATVAQALGFGFESSE